jgi:hypothetical protein
MPLKLGLVQGHILDGDGLFTRNVLQHPIHKGKGVAVRQQTHDLLRIEHGLGRRDVVGGGRGQNSQG